MRVLRHFDEEPKQFVYQPSSFTMGAKICAIDILKPGISNWGIRKVIVRMRMSIFDGRAEKRKRNFHSTPMNSGEKMELS